MHLQEHQLLRKAWGGRHQLAGGPMALQGCVEALALQGEGARVVIIRTMEQQQWLLDLVRLPAACMTPGHKR